MEAWMAFISIMAIVAIVLVAGGLIAFIGHMILGVFDNRPSTSKQNTKEVIDYAQYKQLESGVSNTKEEEKEYNFDAIYQSKAEKEKSLVEENKEDVYALDDNDDELKEIENRLAEKNNATVEEVKSEEIPLNIVEEETEQESKVEDEDVELDDFDLDNMLTEISNDVIEEEKSSEEEISMSDELSSYSIDDLLKQAEEENFEETEETSEDVIEETVKEITEEPLEVIAEEEPELIEEEPVEEIDIKEEVVEEVVENSFEEDLKEEVVEPIVEQSKDDEKDSEIEALKAQLAELNRQLDEAKTAKVEVVRIDTTEEECINRIEVLEERLKNVKKDYKINMKEYRPLKKVMNDLERYQTKLRRKEAVVAKKKVALYGVNNYVDIDKEKAEKLANELELLDGLRLSVSHCEEVIHANKDRFPILEHSNQILEDQISHLEADIAATQETLKKIREKNGNGEGNKE